MQGNKSMDEGKLIQVLKALGHPRRFQMVQQISAAGELSCAQVGRHIPLAQPTVSHHLKILGDAGLLRVRREAQQHFISVNRTLIDQVGKVLPARLRAGLEETGARPRRRPVKAAVSERRRG